jgi:succinyl-diaminopimelate desuccinylase
MMRKCKAKVEMQIVQMEGPTRPTSPNSRIIRLLQSTLKERLGIRAELVGIGGGTIAAYLRTAGYDAAVWSIEDDIAHMPNEYAKISNIEKIVMVFGALVGR